MEFYLPTHLYTGDDVLAKHKDVFAIGKSCLIVTGKSSAKLSGALDDVLSILKELDVKYEIYDGIRQNPTVTSVLEAGEKAKGKDYVIGVGGGSALDAAKVVALVAANDIRDEDTLYKKEYPNTMPTVLVGTTAGTGSEVTPVSVLTDSRNRKHSIRDDKVFATYSLGDPKYTYSLNREFTISTGIDALAHAVESYFSNKANDISRSFSIEAIIKLLPPLTKLSKSEDINSDDRKTLYEASILAGLAISITGTTFAHNCGYYLTEEYHVPHGIASATFLPDLFDYMDMKVKNYSDEFYYRIYSDKDILKSLVTSLLPDLNIRMDEEEITNLLPRYENNSSIKNTRGNMNKDIVKVILESKFSN